MKRLLSIACCNAAALLVLSIAVSAQTPPPKPTTAPAMTKTAPKSNAKASAPKTDADIQKCIQEKFATAKFRDDGLSVAVTGGDATLTGATKVAGHKGNATQF